MQEMVDHQLKSGIGDRRDIFSQLVQNLDEDEEKELLGTPVAFYDTAGCEYFERIDGDGDEGSKCNENEAMVVKNVLEQLVRHLSISFEPRTQKKPYQ